MTDRDAKPAKLPPAIRRVEDDEGRPRALACSRCHIECDVNFSGDVLKTFIDEHRLCKLAESEVPENGSWGSSLVAHAKQIEARHNAQKQQLDGLFDLVRGLVGEMTEWGTREDGVPDEYAYYTRARKYLLEDDRLVPVQRNYACAHCGKAAVCVGAYEDDKNLGMACGDCCAHGNEDGWCRPIDELAAVLSDLAESYFLLDEANFQGTVALTAARYKIKKLTEALILPDPTIPGWVLCRVCNRGVAAGHKLYHQNTCVLFDPTDKSHPEYPHDEEEDKDGD